MVWDTRWPPFWVVDTSSRSALVLRLQSPQVPKVPQLLKVFTLRAGDGGRRRGPHAPHCERVGRGIINSIEPAICRAQTNPGSKALAKHHGTQHRARDASLRGRASRMTGLRCTSSARRAGRGGSTTVLRPARAQHSSLGLSSTGPSSLPPTPAGRSVPAKSPRRPSAPHAGKRRGALS